MAAVVQNIFNLLQSGRTTKRLLSLTKTDSITRKRSRKTISDQNHETEEKNLIPKFFQRKETIDKFGDAIVN